MLLNPHIIKYNSLLNKIFFQIGEDEFIDNEGEFCNFDEPNEFSIYLIEDINNKKQNSNNQIFNISKVPKVKVKGRPKKNSLGEKKHNCKSVDNASKSIINKCSKYIFMFIQEHARLFSKKYKKRGYKVPYFKNNEHLLKGNKDKQKLFKRTIKDLLFDVKTNIGLSNLRKIQNLLDYELENDKIETKKLNILFNLQFKFYLEKMLNDEDLIIDGVNYVNDKYKTLKDMFTSGNKIFTNREKHKYKSYIIKIMDAICIYNRFIFYKVSFDFN